MRSRISSLRNLFFSISKLYTIVMREFDENIILETPHLILRFLKSEDRRAIYDNINHDKEVLKYYVASYTDDYDSFSIDSYITSYKEKKMYFLAIIEKQSNQVIGNIFQISRPNAYMRSSEIGYAIGKKHWNKGYMSEALKVFINLLFESGVHKVFACHISENKASGRVMEKCGMIYEGRRKDELYYHERYWDCDYYYLIGDETWNTI